VSAKAKETVKVTATGKPAAASHPSALKNRQEEKEHWWPTKEHKKHK
jgi:hypothetical protein